MAASITWHDSVANFIGGTTKQLEFEKNGLARHWSSPPASAWTMSMQPGMFSGPTKDVPMCLVVPRAQA